MPRNAWTCCLMALLTGPLGAGEAELEARILRHLTHGGVVVTRGDAVLFEHRGDERFVPASTLKIATAAAALHYLGAEYRFRTEIWRNARGDLWIRGYGDPFLVSEEWNIVLDELTRREGFPEKIGRLYLDTSAFSEIKIPGIASSLNPYDASNGALAANFNTIHVRIESDGTVRSAEDQTPLTPLGRRLGRGLSAGRHRINLSRDPKKPPIYVGELLRALFKKRGFEISGFEVLDFRVSDFDADAFERIYTHENSRTLDEVIAAMMLYSNNFIANQILLTIGLEKSGAPATLAKGVAYLDRFLVEEAKLDRAEFQVVEGSGISRKNFMTPRALARVVQAFYPHRRLLAKDDGLALKTGTLSGVYTLAGFLPEKATSSKEAGSLPPFTFVILLNQEKNTRRAVLGELRRRFIDSPR